MPRPRNDDTPRPAREDTDLFLAGEDNGARGFEYAPDPRRLDHGYYSERGDSGQDNPPAGQASYYAPGASSRNRNQQPQRRDDYPGSYGGQAATFGHGINRIDEPADYAGARTHQGRGPKGYTRSDDRILDDVVARLTDDDRIDASDVSVQVIDGRVILDGLVQQRSDRRYAEDVADAVRGVVDVDNRLRVEARR